MALICPDCGNKKNFQVKTLRIHIIEMEGSRVDIADEDPPAVLEVLCDECEAPLQFGELDPVLQREVLLTISAR